MPWRATPPTSNPKSSVPITVPSPPSYALRLGLEDVFPYFCAMSVPVLLRYERAAYRNGATRVAGVDEAGRGPLAGPVVAAAVILPREHNSLFCRSGPLHGLTDSKQLSEVEREKFFAFLLHPSSSVLSAVGIADVDLIAELNILGATHWAMREALRRLPQAPDHVLVDGRAVPHLPAPQTALVQGDAKSFSIAAASVLAKVTRDRLMRELDKKYPQYGFAKHKGYGTAAHLAALQTFGPCPAHRRHFDPVRQPRLAFA